MVQHHTTHARAHAGACRFSLTEIQVELLILYLKTLPAAALGAPNM